MADVITKEMMDLAHEGGDFGWVGHSRPDIQAQAIAEFGPIFRQAEVLDSIPDRVMLWEVTRKILNGQDLPNIPQLIGNCVAHSTKNGLQYLQVIELGLGRGDKWRSVCSAYLYGIGRVQIGKRQLGRQDGSSGHWQAAACEKYGVLFEDVTGVPKDSASLDKDWGYNGPPANFLTEGQKYLVKFDGSFTAALVTTTDQMMSALAQYQPVTVASNVGYDMKQRSDGFMHYSTHWGHQMTFLGYDKGDKAKSIPPHICLNNNWGDVFGEIKDFRDPNVTWPKGTLRITFEDAQKQLDEQDSFKYSNFDLGVAPIPTITIDDFNLF